MAGAEGGVGGEGTEESSWDDQSSSKGQGAWHTKSSELENNQLEVACENFNILGKEKIEIMYVAKCKVLVIDEAWGSEIEQIYTKKSLLVHKIKKKLKNKWGYFFGGGLETQKKRFCAPIATPPLALCLLRPQPLLLRQDVQCTQTVP